MKRLLLSLLAAVLVSASCDSTSPTLLADVQVSFATRAAGVSPAMGVGANQATFNFLDDTIVSGNNTLIITSAEVVLREVELKRVETVNCDDENDACEKFTSGPILVDLPLEEGARVELRLDIPPGAYDEIEFDVHKVDDSDPLDQAFVQMHPDFVDLSIRVRGTFNGNSFVFESDVGVEQELDLAPPLQVADGEQANITVFVDVREWFVDENGALIDPVTANEGGPNKSIVEEYIKRSFEAFEDDDEDGSR